VAAEEEGEKINIKDRMKQIPGVTAAAWNADEMKLTIIYEQGFDLEQLKIRVLSKVEEAFLERAIDKFEYIQEEKIGSETMARDNPQAVHVIQRKSGRYTIEGRPNSHRCCHHPCGFAVEETP